MLANLPLNEIILVLGCMLISLSFHEAMHAFAAHFLGDTTAQEQGRLTLNPLKHLDIFTTVALPLVMMLLHQPPFFIAKPVPFDPDRVRHDEYGAAAVALAGPFTNLALAVFGALVLRAAGVDLGAGMVHALVVFVQVNILFFVFNMIPFPPLDGSRLLYAFAPDPVRQVMVQIEATGLVGILAFILILYQFIGPLISNISQSIFNFLLN